MASAQAAPSKASESLSHPPGLYVLFATEMWERFSFYTMGAMFVLYLRDHSEGFGWTKAEATTLYSNYSMFVYASPLLGGYLASTSLGLRRAVMVGGLFFIAGHLLLSFYSITIVYAALVCLVIGNGFFKPNISAMVGALYPAGSPLKERAYNFFYMGINIGAFLAPVTAEIVKSRYGYHPAFAVAAGGMVLSVLILWWFKRFIEEPKRGASFVDNPTAQDAYASGDPPIVVEKRHPIDSVPDWKRIAALIVIFIIVIVFWMVFHQNHTTITYWGADNTDWQTLRAITSPFRNPADDAEKIAAVVGVAVLGPGEATCAMAAAATAKWQPSGIITNAINPLWVILLTFPLVFVWKVLNRYGLEPSTPTKMALGMVMTGFAFLVLYAAALQGEESATDPLKHRFVVSDVWLIGTFAVLTLAELMLSPMGLALVAKVSPPRYLSLMMGGWFVATAIGNKLTVIGVFWDDWQHSTFWLLLAGLSFAMSAVLLVLLVPLKKAMPGV